jgi:hypothetical protein
MDMFVEQTHAVESSSERPMRFTDSRVDEQDRGISLKSVPMSLVLEGGNGKSYVMNLMDTPGEQQGWGSGEERKRGAEGQGDAVNERTQLTQWILHGAGFGGGAANRRIELDVLPCLPVGHVNFSDELSASLRLSDGVLLVVDAVEGVMVGTERAIKAAAAEGLPICLLISKFDRWAGAAQWIGVRGAGSRLRTGRCGACCAPKVRCSAPPMLLLNPTHSPLTHASTHPCPLRLPLQADAGAEAAPHRRLPQAAAHD